MKKIVLLSFILFLSKEGCFGQNLWTLGGRAYVDNSGGGDFNAAYTGPPNRTGPYQGGYINGGCSGFPNPCGDNSFNINPSNVTNPGAFRMTYDQVALVTQTASQVYYNNTISLASNFTMYFNVFFGCRNISGGDGMIFVLTNARQTPGASSGGGNLGYVGVNNSVGIEFDTYRNTVNNDPLETTTNSTDHIAIVRNGSVTHPVSPVGTFPNGDGPFNFTNAFGRNADGNIEDCDPHSLRITWNASTKVITAYLDGIIAITSNVDIPAIIGTSNAYWGFTAGMQGTSNEQWFTYDGTSSPPISPYDCSAGGTDVPGCVPVLPVEYLFYNVKKINSQAIELEWATTSEEGNSFFEIQRSNDGINWFPIGEVKGQGYSQSITYYSFKDNSPFEGDNYYRFIQHDYNGRANQSAIKHLRLDNNLIRAMVYPNPATDKITIELLNSNQNRWVTITNQLQQEVFHQELTESKQELNLENFNPGLYFISIYSEAEQWNEKIVVIK